MKKKQKGGSSKFDVVGASISLVESMVYLGEDIFKEIDAITNIQRDINNGPSASNTMPQTQGPPAFTAPSLTPPPTTTKH
jgi:hypothetical protein